VLQKDPLDLLFYAYFLFGGGGFCRVIGGLSRLGGRLIFVLGGFWFGGCVFIGAIVFSYRTKDIFCVEGYDFFALWGNFSRKIFV